MSLSRRVLLGLSVGALAGAAVGLVLGLIAYPPTAWFAVIEVGVPAAMLGAVTGLVVHGIIVASRGIRSRPGPVRRRT
ncbi:hypothetical protein ABZ477_00185 [Microbacterium sp. NPDC019599]|uniref:hypothetical protein n=1 Tax=Microbacterium sp. NPDC019599 TaxID=3154690 RepID=UPI00340754BE